MRTGNSFPFLIAIFGITLVSSGLRADPPSSLQWNLTFSDNFDGNALDDTKWSYR